MPAHRNRTSLPLAAALSVLSVLAAMVAPAFGFSKIGSDGQHEGIVSVPLPDLADSAGAPAGSAGAATGTGNAGTPPSVTPAAGTTTAPAPATEPAASGEPRSQSASPSRTAPAQATDPNSTDEGEVPAGGDEGDADGPIDPAGPGQPGTATVAPDGVPGQSPIAPDGKVTNSADDADTPPADIRYGDADLPPPVRDLREKLMAIARTGDIEALRPYIEPGEDGTVLTFGGPDGDPIEYLKSASGDGDGVEILAILLEILQAGHVRTDPATDNEVFVWPYFTGVAVDKLTRPQKVELFELVTAGDYQEMVGFGAYNFYRAGISPDGKLQFFVAGD